MFIIILKNVAKIILYFYGDIMEKFIDLRSDTVTRPTNEMREAMFNAEVGDDVLSEDPTINKLEKLAAELLNKEAAMFVPSGTFGNQVSLFTHCGKGDEVILSDESHIIQHEAGAGAIIAGAQFRTISPEKSYITWEEIEPKIRKEKDIHYPETRLIELENATANGDVMPLEEMEKIYNNAKKYNINIHLDGARIFNAAAYLRVNVSEIAKYADSVMFCLSKGLCSPVGSMVAGKKEFIEKARKKRKIMGGGMRQAGILAAAGIVSLTKMTERLKIDHLNAKKLADAFINTGLFNLFSEKVKINMFFIQFKDKNLQDKQWNFVEFLKEYKILTYPPENGWIRFVTHNDVKESDIDYIVKMIPDIVSKWVEKVNKS